MSSDEKKKEKKQRILKCYEELTHTKAKSKAISLQEMYVFTSKLLWTLFRSKCYAIGFASMKSQCLAV